MRQTVSTNIDKLLEIVENLRKIGDPRRVALFLSNKHPQDVASVLERLPSDWMIKVFKFLPVETQADVLIYISEDKIEELIESLSNKDIAELVGEMDPDDAADFISELEEKEKEKVLPLASDEVKELLKFEESSAGGLMSKKFITVPEDATVEETLKKIEDFEEEVVAAFVTDKEGRLTGVVYLKDLLKVPPETKVREIVKDIPAVKYDMDQEEVARIFEKYDLFFLPVIDDDDRMIGIITVDDILDVIEEETSEDIARLAGLGGIQSLLIGPVEAAKSRLPWLIGNLVTAFIASSVVAIFKDTIDKYAYLAVFMPVIAGMGGNGAIQVIALTVRALALGEITKHDALKILKKEFFTGFLIGISVGFVTGVVAWLWVGKWFFGVLVLIALLINMVVACLVGFLIPLTVKFLGVDPALVSGVLATTFTDVTGYFVFLGLATIFLKKLLGF